jgi:hypothetical protein
MTADKFLPPLAGIRLAPFGLRKAWMKAAIDDNSDRLIGQTLGPLAMFFFPQRLPFTLNQLVQLVFGHAAGSKVLSHRCENIIKRWTRGLSRNHSFNKSLDIFALRGRFFGQNVLYFFGNRNRYFHTVRSLLKHSRGHHASTILTLSRYRMARVAQHNNP